MNSFLLCLVVTMTSFCKENQVTSYFDIPKTWTKEYVITLSFTGSMDGSSTQLKFTYDSCIYTRNTGMKPSKTGISRMTDNDRKDILATLRELKVNKVKTEVKPYPVNDGYSSLLCFGHHCLQGGTSVTMNDHDQEVFEAAYSYLEGLAIKKMP